MKTPIMLGALLIIAPSALASEPVNKGRIRGLITLPQIPLKCGGIGITSLDGFVLPGDEHDIPAETAALKKMLKGDATDAERYSRLADLYQFGKDPAQARQARLKAIETYRQQVKTQPNNGVFLSRLGMELWGLDEFEEAEKLLRKAIQIAPKESQCWLALANFLNGKSMRALFADESGPVQWDTSQLVGFILERKPAEAKIREHQKHLAESRDCFAKAIALAPREKQPLIDRSLARMIQAFLQVGLDMLQQKGTNVMDSLVACGFMDDIRLAATIDPNDFRAVGASAMYEVLFAMAAAASAKKPADSGKKGLWESLPDETKQAIQKPLAVLEKSAQGQESPTAGAASLMLGMLQVVLEFDLEKAETNLRRAVWLNPSSDQAWDLLCVALSSRERYDDFVIACNDRLKLKNNAHNRYILAIAHVNLKQFDKAEEQLHLAIKLEPDDLYSNLGRAMLLLKRGQNAETLAAARAILEKLENQLNKETPSEDRIKCAIGYCFYLALADNAGEARNILKQVLGSDKDNKDAKALLEALEK